MNKRLPVKVEFCGAVLEGVIVDGRAFVAMKPVVEGLGLDWTRQLQKLKDDPVLGPEVSNIRGMPSAGGKQAMVCLPEERLQGWLFRISPAKVKASIRDKLITYQREAYRVLHEAFSQGVAATNLRVMAIDSKRAAGKLMTDMARDILLIDGRIPKPHHYMNEHRLVNWALTGEYAGLNEGALDYAQLELLAALRRKNAVLLGRGLSYEQRKLVLQQYAQDWQAEHQLLLVAA